MQNKNSRTHLVLDDHQQHLEHHIVSFCRDLLSEFLLVLLHRTVILVDDAERAAALVSLGQRRYLLAHVSDGDAVVKHFEGNDGII